MKTVLVTGASGFLGSKLALDLANHGYLIIANGRNEEKLKRLQHKNISLVAAELHSLSSQIISPVDIVVHCAALASPWGPRSDFMKANVQGTQHILDFCQNHKVQRLVHISTPSVYVSQKSQLQIKEDDFFSKEFINFYAETKWLAEQLILSEKYQSLEKIILRPQGIIGEGDQNIFPRMIALGKKGTIPVIGDGKNLMDLTCVENVCQAILLSMTCDKKFSGQIYNVSNDEPVDLRQTLSDILNRLGIKYREKHVSFRTAFNLGAFLEILYKTKLFGKEPPLTKYTACVLGKSRTLDLTKIKTDLQYKPQVSIQDGIDRVIKRYQNL